MADVTSLRCLYDESNIYDYEGITIVCGEIYKETPEYVRFTLGFPLELLGIAPHGESNIFTADYCLRIFAGYIENISLENRHNAGKEKYAGRIFIYKPKQAILLRNSSYVKDETLHISLTIRFSILMAQKRSVVNGGTSVKIVRKELAREIREFIRNFDIKYYEEQTVIYERQQEIRRLLDEKRLVSFIANGCVLPRNKTGGPLAGAVSFVSPPEDEAELHLSDGFIVKGMGIKQGVTVITGGGYSGKSTLLDAVMHGIYDHVSGDGREYCVTRKKSCKIIAEDGRIVSSLDISAFVRETGCLKTKRFTTEHASGSTSQAANIMEAISFGCEALLIDEDRTATNFMIRDARMKKIIKDDPIVPFTDRVRQIYADTGVSTVLIIGGSSEYLDLADNVYIMKNFIISNYNNEVAATRQNDFKFFNVEDHERTSWKLDRIIKADPMATFIKDETINRIREHINLSEKKIYIGIHRADVSRLDTVISEQQITAIAFIIRALFNELNKLNKPKGRLIEEMQAIYANINENGLESFYSNRFGVDFNMEQPTFHDILFALSRIHGLLE